MPVFKVRSDCSEQKFTVCADSINSLIEKAVDKLKLDGAVLYKLLDSTDGSVIDDDDCLCDMARTAASTGSHMTIVIVPEDRQWSPHMFTSSETSIPPYLQTPPPSRPGSPHRENLVPQELCTPIINQPTSSSQTTTSGDQTLPSINQFVRDLKTALESSEKVRRRKVNRTRRAVARSVADTFFKRNSHEPGAIMKYASKIVDSCPEAFQINIKSAVSDSGLNSFVKSIYNMVGYRKDVDLPASGSNTRQRRKRRRQQDLSENEDEPEMVPYLYLDSNGCCEGMWDPPLPDDESNESLEEKRRLLLSYASFPGCEDDVNAIRLCKETYPSQRSAINSARSIEDWRNLFSSWPILLKKTFLFLHCDKLLGKNVSEVFYNELSGAPIFLTFMEKYCQTQEERPSKNSRYLVMSDYITRSKAAEINLRSKQPISIAMFPLLVGFMKEKESDFFILVEETTSTEDMLLKAKETSMCPLLVVKASSVFDNRAECAVAVRGEFLIHVKNVLEGILVLFVCYFAFNVAYPKTICNTLEFMQRFYLKINPEKQAVRTEGAKRSLQTVSASVAKLASGLQELETLQSQWSMD